MKSVKHILTLVFGLLGLVYTAIGGVMLNVTGADPDLPLLGNIFFILGAAFLAAAVLVWYFISRRERRRAELMTYGIRVSATVTDIRVNYGVKVNRRSPVVVYATCTHPVTREEVTLASHNLWNCTTSTGQKVDICFDQMNEKLYAFDLHEEAGA